MKVLRPVASISFALLVSAELLAQSMGPGDRQITDPHSLSSAPNPKARPIPIDDLYPVRQIVRRCDDLRVHEIAPQTVTSGSSFAGTFAQS